MKERGLFRSTIAALAGKDLRPAFAERKAKKELALYEAHFTSPTVKKFYNDAADRAMAHRKTSSAMAISHLLVLDAASMHEWRHNQISWDNQPEAVKAVFEIALTIAQAEMTRKSRRGIILVVGEGQDAMIPEDDAFVGDSSYEPFGMRNPDTEVVGALYKLLGLEEKSKDIPAVPGFNRFFHANVYRQHELADYGVRLRFNFSGSSAGEFGNGTEVPFYPAHIGMTVSAKRTMVK